MNRLTVIVFCLAATTACAQSDDLVGDRPDFTESALSVAPGRLQIETGVTIGESGDVESTEIGEILLRWGWRDRTEIRLGLGSWMDLTPQTGDGASGLSDLELGFKHELASGEGRRPQMALIGALALPTGGEDVTADATQPAVIACTEWELGERAALGSNLGWSLAYDGERFSQVWLSAALGLSLSETVGMFIEGYGFSREADGGDATQYADVGATLLLRPDLQLDARFGKGFNDLDSDWFFGVGVILKR